MAEKYADKPRVDITTLGHPGHGKSSLTRAAARTLHQAHPSLNPFELTPGQSLSEAGNLVEHWSAGDPNVLSATLQTEARVYTLVDHPGDADHDKALEAIAARTAGALLVIDAVHGPTDRTREHVALAQRIGVPAIVVALNKADTSVDEEALELTEIQVRDLLTEHGYPGDELHVVRVSALRAQEDDQAWAASVLALTAALDEGIPQPH